MSQLAERAGWYLLKLAEAVKTLMMGRVLRVRRPRETHASLKNGLAEGKPALITSHATRWLVNKVSVTRPTSHRQESRTPEPFNA